MAMLEESFVIKIVSSKDVNRMTKNLFRRYRKEVNLHLAGNQICHCHNRKVSFCELLFVPVFGRCKHRPAVSLVIAVSCGKLLY